MKGTLTKTEQGWAVKWFDSAQAHDIMYCGESLALHPKYLKDANLINGGYTNFYEGKEVEFESVQHIDKCEGASDNGCYMDSPGHDCGCQKTYANIIITENTAADEKNETMSTQDAVNILFVHQKWRLGADIEMIEPKLLTKAIDVVLEYTVTSLLAQKTLKKSSPLSLSMESKFKSAMAMFANWAYDASSANLLEKSEHKMNEIIKQLNVS